MIPPDPTAASGPSERAEPEVGLYGEPGSLSAGDGTARRRRAAWPPLRPCRATQACTAAVLVAFAAQWAAGAFFDPVQLLALGANSSLLVKAGEWQRLVTGNLLHGGLLHLGLNLIALLYLGALFELLLGPRRFLTLFLISCLGGSLASAYLTGALIAVGSSTGLLGLIGANVVLAWRFSTDRKRTLRSQGLLLFFALVVPMAIPNADHFGHIGGLLAGMLVVILTMPEKTVRELRLKRRDPFATWASVVLTLLFVGVSVETAVRYFTVGTRPAAASLLRGAQSEEIHEFILNSAAWTLAIDPASSREELESARRGMLWVEEEEPKLTVAERDTLATVEYRRGDFDRAVALEREVLELAQEPELARIPGIGDEVPFFAAQLARFEWARYRERGPLKAPGVDLPRADLVLGPEMGCGGPPAVPGLAGERPKGTGLMLTGTGGRALEVHVVLARGDAPLAFVKALVGLTALPGGVFRELESEAFDCDVRAVVTLAEPIAPFGDYEPVRWQAWGMDEEAVALP